MESEIWKPILGFEGLYEVSNLGRVKTLPRVVINKRGTRTPIKEKIKKVNYVYGDNYLRIFLYKAGKQSTHLIHRLVAKAFLLKIEGKDFVTHVDGDRQNNKVENLQYCNSSENKMSQERRILRREDIKGRKFGNLLVLSDCIRDYDSKGHSTYKRECLCDCGNKSIVREYNLKNGTIKTCGCRKFRLEYGIASFNFVYAGYKSSAKKKGLEFTLTKEAFKEITKKPCHYCGQKPTMKGEVSKNKGEKREMNGYYIHNGIDRVDNSRGYEKDNCVPCCSHCNYAKRTLSQKEFKIWINKVYANLKCKGEI